MIAAPFQAYIDDWSFEALDEVFTQARITALRTVAFLMRSI